MPNSDPSRNAGYSPVYAAPNGAAGVANDVPLPPMSVQPASAPPQANGGGGGNRPLPIAPKAVAPANSNNGYPLPQPNAGPRPPNRPTIADGAAKIQDPSPQAKAEEEDEKPMRALRSAPPWLISLIVHMVLMLMLALAFFTPQITKPFEVEVEVVDDEIWAEEIGEQLIDNVLTSPLSDITTGEASLTPNDLMPVDDPLAAPPQVDLQLEGNGFASNIAAPNIGLALSGRQSGSKTTLLAAYGGTASTETSVQAGLEWLKKNQRPDGSWSLVGPYKDGGSSENRNAATAMALLAFQGAGHTDTTGAFAKNVEKGWQFLLKQQAKSGSFIPSDDTPDHHNLYTHAQATIALCELYGMTKNSKYREAAQQAVDFCVAAQSPEGGWRYQPKQEADMSVTGWFVMALQSAMMAKLEVPSTTLANVNRFLDTVAVDDGERYSYRPGSFVTSAVSAEGLLCREYLGWKRDDPRLVAGVEQLLQSPVNYSDQNVYYWYYATQAAHHMEGQAWDRWNRVMRQEVPSAQVKSGPEAGSWSPTQDEWGARGAGRLFTTCLSIYMLEVYYRHLPIYAEVYKYKLQQF